MYVRTYYKKHFSQMHIFVKKIITADSIGMHGLHLAVEPFSSYSSF